MPRNGHRSWTILVGLAAAAFGCGGGTGLSPVTYPFVARGSDAAPFTTNGWAITVDDARVGIGPLYLCASQSASADLCGTAVAEFAATAVVDATRTDSQPLGEITGFDGTVHSALYDFAFSWPDERGARALPGAPDGHSAMLAVTARKGDRTLRVRAALDIAPQQPRAHAVQARLAATPQTAALRLEITVSASAWWRHVDFDALSLAAADDIVLPALSDTSADDPAAAPDVRAAAGARAALLAAMTSTDRPNLVFTTP
ncbi:MAG: hypothetical protein ABUS79_20475 [Pseudomonadota bacterium]